MERMWMYFTVVLAITANLLTPEQWVSYHDCCYDESGRIAACASNTASHPRTPVIRNACCDPITHQLRTAPAPVVLDGHSPCNVPHIDAIPAPVPMLVIHLDGGDLNPRVVFATGPPSSPDILARHCRFNI